MTDFPHIDVVTEYGMTNSCIKLQELKKQSYVAVSDPNTFGWYDFRSLKDTHVVYGLPHSEGYIGYAANRDDMKHLYRGKPEECSIQVCIDVMALDIDTYGDEQYLAVDRTRQGSFAANQLCAEISNKNGVPLIATNRPRFNNPDDYYHQRVINSVHAKTVVDSFSENNNVSSNQWLKDASQMKRLFNGFFEPVDNAYYMFERCTGAIETFEPETPSFTGDRQEDIDQLKSILEIQIRNRERIDYELSIICSMGFAGYFLIVADFCRWAIQNDISVGCGRGSGAGSIVAFLLGITDIDPIKYGLIFERFLNPDRVSLPDFDIDFTSAGRDSVVSYCRRKYGPKNVGVIMTLSRFQDSEAINAAARALGGGKAHSDMLSNNIKQGLGLDRQLQEVYDVSLFLKDMPKNFGKHAAGVVIDNAAISGRCPVFVSGGTLTGLEMKPVEAIGLVKFDFLALSTLDQIDLMKELMGIVEIPEEITDGERFIYENGLTGGLFQIESIGMRELIMSVVPDSISELSDCIALYRPGPIESGMVAAYELACKGLEYKSPFKGVKGVKKILEPTKGQLIYQEQVLQIARKVSGFTLAEADLLRRAMGKKIRSEMKDVENRFVSRCKQGEKQGKKIFNAIEKFAGYGFNKSHSISYATISHHTSYLKAEDPISFYVALLNLGDSNKRIMNLINLARVEYGIKFIKPDVSAFLFTKIDDRTIRIGLTAINQFTAASMTKYEAGNELPKGAGDNLELALSKDAAQERKAYGFNIVNPPVRKGQYYIIAVANKVTKKGSSMAVVKAMANDMIIRELLFFGEIFHEYKSLLSAGAIISNLSYRGDDAIWVKSANIKQGN